MSDKISKTFRRLIKTGEFEPVEVISTIEREINTTEHIPGSHQYDEQVNYLRDQATDQLVDDLNMIVDKLGISEKRVKVTSTRPRPAHV